MRWAFMLGESRVFWNHLVKRLVVTAGSATAVVLAFGPTMKP